MLSLTDVFSMELAALGEISILTGLGKSEFPDIETSALVNTLMLSIELPCSRSIFVFVLIFVIFIFLIDTFLFTTIRALGELIL